MAEHLEKLIKSTQSHHQMRHAMTERSLAIAADLEDQRQQRAEQLAQDQAQEGQAGNDPGQGPHS